MHSPATLDLAAQTVAARLARIPLPGRLTPAQVAAHNAFIDEMREGSQQDYVSAQSRFVGVKAGTPHATTI